MQAKFLRKTDSFFITREAQYTGEQSEQVLAHLLCLNEAGKLAAQPPVDGNQDNLGR